MLTFSVVKPTTWDPPHIFKTLHNSYTSVVQESFSFYKKKRQKRQAMAFRGMLLQQKLLLRAFILAATVASQPDPNCNKTCGNLCTPYPFGTSESCYLDSSFLITCNYLSGIPTPFLRKGNITIRDISLDGELRILSFIARDCYNKSGFPVNRTKSHFTVSKFPVSYTRNKFTVVGCDTYAYISGAVQATLGVTGLALALAVGCCQTSISEGTRNFTARVQSFENHTTVFGFNPCSFGFVVEEEAYNFTGYTC
jgi:hypothetical protein